MADKSIVDSNGAGAALTATQHDNNLDSLCSVVDPMASTSYTIAYTDQNKTIECTNASSIAITLPASSTITSLLDTSSFFVRIKNIGAGVVTITGPSNSIDGATTLVLNQWDAVTLQADSGNTVWNIITRDMDVVDINGGTIDGVTIDGATINGSTIGATTPAQATFADKATITGNSAVFQIIEDDATADEGHWRFIAGSDELKLQAIDDSNANAVSVYRILRTGTTVDTLSILSTNLLHNGVAVATEAYVDARPKVLAAVATTSGDPVEIVASGIFPAGCTHVELAFYGVSLTINDDILVQLQDSAYVTSGYKSAASSIDASGGTTDESTSTAGFLMQTNHTGPDLWHGVMTFKEVGTNEWVMVGQSMDQNDSIEQLTGYITLSGELDGIRVKSTGSQTFDAGSCRVTYY